MSLHFPDGFELSNDTEIISKPQPPDIPKDFASFITTSSNLIKGISSYLYIPDINLLMASSRLNYYNENVKLIDIKKINSYKVDYKIQKIKHHQVEKLDKLYAIFENADVIKSFNINYEVNADNLPEVVNGKLEVNFTVK